MKKLTLLAASVSLALGLTACSPQPSDQSKTDVSQQQTKSLESGVDLSAVKDSVRAQDDFFQHVNGAWLDKTEIPADKSSYGMFHTLYDDTQENLKALIQEAANAGENAEANAQKLGAMYNSYMNEVLANELGIKPIQSELDTIRSVDSYKGVAQQMGMLNRIGVDAPFGFFVYPDAQDPTKYGLWLYQSGLTLPDRDYYFKEEDKYVQFREETVKYMADMLKMAGHESPEQAANAVFDLEKRIAEKHLSRVESRDAEKNYNKRSATEVNALLGDFDFATYAKAVSVDHADNLIVRQLPYFESFSELFNSADVQTWKDYMTFKTVDTYASQLSSEFVDRSFAFHSTTLNGIPEQRPRWKRAVAATSGTLGEVLGQQYVAKHFTPEAKAKMDQLVQNLIKAYGESIKDLEWMTAETKEAALEKLSKFTPKIGYPDKWRDYSELELNEDDLVGNYKRAREFEHVYETSRIGEDVDPADWGMSPQTVNAYYSPTRNEIVFPAGILQPPFFNMSADDAVNYGAIGAVIGHEIGHGFDDQGSKYDGDGNLRSWWSEEDRNAFDARGKKLVEQFNQFEPIEGLKVNGELTLGENIGDLAGATIGYRAYKMSLNGEPAPVIEGLTGDQRFFMGYAQIWRGKYREDALRSRLLSDPHSPGEYRVNGIVGNVDAFYEAFDVKEGDGMYIKPEDRVKIW
ncbi:peptidase M13 [Aestuariibacter sp. AA17]|uniref:Peptidase M13 n=1 Tax=Fluctibacter corallii TaxID=2984329 RepID=A0ABT3A8K1_9ALTE|nr:M13 family metallopeptidase [Aestuariibacter sp. AA17]MCV2884930.1 peptidase M13 [Aestuariibacter sp. AA17]